MTALSAIFSVICLAIVLLGGLIGYKSGMYKGAIRVASGIVAFILALVFAKIIVSGIFGIDALQNVIDNILESNKELSDLVNSSPTVKALITAIPAAMIAPTVFTLLFFLFYGLLAIPGSFALKKTEQYVAGKSQDENGVKNEKYIPSQTEKLIGIPIGIIRTAIIMLVLLLPAAGIVSLASDAAETAVSLEKSEDTSKLDEVNCDYIQPVSGNVALKVTSALGGRAVFNTLTKIEIDGKKVSVSKEIGYLCAACTSVAPVISDKTTDYGAEHIDGVRGFSSIMNKSDVFPKVAAEVLSFGAGNWQKGDTFIGIDKPDVDDSYSDMLDSGLNILSTSTADTVKNDISTVSDIFASLVNHDIFNKVKTSKESSDASSGIAIAKDVSEKEFLADVMTIIYDNERWRPLLADSADVGLNVMCDVLSAKDDISYEKVNMKNVTRLQIQTEAGTLSDIVADALKFYDSMPDNDDEIAEKSDMASLGRALDGLKISLFFGPAYTDIMRVLLDSEIVNSLGFVNDAMRAKILNNKNASMENILASAKSLVSFGNEVAYIPQGILDGENFSESFYQLLSVMSEDSADILKEGMTEEFIGSLGFNDEETMYVAPVMRSLLPRIAEANDNMTDDERKAEADAAMGLMKTVMSSATIEGNQMFFDDVLQDSADNLLESLMSSTVCTGTVVDVASDENGNVKDDPFGVADSMTEKDKNEMKDAILDYFTENGGTAEDVGEMRSSLLSIGSIFGLDLTADLDAIK